MCGIAGFQGGFPRSLLKDMTDAVAHRGPDGEGEVFLEVAGQKPTGLGHRRLAIIDLSLAGIQPMSTACKAQSHSGLTLVFNGEIYNYRELREELIDEGHTFRTATDSEVLLHLYERDGLGMLGRLNGIFAFAIHDGREADRPSGMSRGALFIARDHLGVKPLYYAETANGVLFGSEIKSLTAWKALPRDVDPVALHQMLAYLWTPAPRTMLAAVRKLEPGSAMIVDEGRIRRKWSYYRLPYDGVRAVGTYQAIEAELAERLEVAVRRQLVADVPVGAFLSGGLDSSAIVAMMRRAQPDQRIDCFTIGIDGEVDSEGAPADLPYARLVAKHLGVQLHEIMMDPAAINRLPEIIALLDEPQADPAPINALLIAERAREMSIPVLLSGAGGDDIFTGYRRHWALQFERRWSWLPKFIRGGLQASAGALASGAGVGQTIPAIRRATKMFAYAGETEDRRLISYFWWSTEGLRRGLYSPAFAARVSLADVAEPLLTSLATIPNEPDRIQKMLFLETRHFLADHNLNYTDRAGMAAGVEIRVPLLDTDLVRFAATIPVEQKQAGRIGKAVFKRAMEPLLPREVIYRPKTGFGAPLRRWLRNELAPMVEDALAPDVIAKRGFFDPMAVRRLIEQDRAGTVDGSYTLFALICFELWCRRFVDQ